MGARGKIRRRANGELVRGKTKGGAPPAGPLMLDVDGAPVEAVTPEVLADAVTIRNQHVPILLPLAQEIEIREGVEGMAARVEQADSEIVTKWDEAVSWRTHLLCELLTREGPLYHGTRQTARLRSTLISSNMPRVRRSRIILTSSWPGILKHKGLSSPNRYPGNPIAAIQHIPNAFQLWSLVHVEGSELVHLHPMGQHHVRLLPCLCRVDEIPRMRSARTGDVRDRAASWTKAIIAA